MPANLPPQFIETRNKLSQVKTPQEKIAIYEELLTIIPKHKGTDRLQGDIKSKIAKLKLSSQQKSNTSRQVDSFYVPKEGSGQIVLIGPPNSGKSSLLAKLTNAKPIIADYPYSTRSALSGMMKFENIQIQLVDTPALGDLPIEAGIFQVIRLADIICIVLSLTEDPLKQFESIKSKLQEHKIGIGAETEIETEKLVFQKTLILANKIDASGTSEILEIFCSLFEEKIKILPISAIFETGLNEVALDFYKLLNIIRVYPKTPGQKPDYHSPVVLKKIVLFLCLQEKFIKNYLKN
ncbi:MAG: GTPase [bacterium]